MDKQEVRKLEELLDKIMMDAPLESPSKDFTKNIMQKIQTESVKEVFQYKPILSKKMLTGLFVSFVALIVYLGFKFGGQNGNDWFGRLNWEPDFQPLWGWLERYTSSNVLIYAVILFGFLFFVQVPLLKKHMDKTVLS